ncbi:MAG TPA: alpha/beta fold hydrolase [Cellvibrionaceae bacterium]
MPNSNPNSRQKLALQLMMQDPQDSVYINRPCYGYHGEPPTPCEPRWWTSARYHPIIVTALNDAIDKVQKNHGAKPLVLIGHSGGGSLAMLVAQLRDDVVGVVTIAGNLDPDAWTHYHRYEALSDSENPSLASPLDSGIFRWHFVGKDDNNIPPALSAQALTNDSDAELFTTDNGHNCCWVKQWPDILERLDQHQQRGAE